VHKQQAFFIPIIARVEYTTTYGHSKIYILKKYLYDQTFD